jgi:hypothetical protein
LRLHDEKTFIQQSGEKTLSKCCQCFCIDSDGNTVGIFKRQRKPGVTENMVEKRRENEKEEVGRN